MHPRDFLDDIVKPTLEEARQDPLSVRKTILAILVSDALFAQVYHSHDQSVAANVARIGKANDDTEFRHLLSNNCSDCGLLRDAAKAQKHVYLKRGKPVISSADSLKVRCRGWGQGGYGEGPYGGGDQIVIELDNGDTRNAMAVVTKVVKFIETTFL